jgi:hypothetical protein
MSHTDPGRPQMLAREAGHLDAGRDQPRVSVDPVVLTRLALPAHVTVWALGRWRRGWVIGRDRQPGGWLGLVQYDSDDAVEVTEWLPAERIASAECWLGE